MSKSRHPGETLRFILFEEEVPVDTVAERIGLSGEQLRGLVNGEISVTPEIAVKLSKLSGTTPEMWLELQAAFERDAATQKIMPDGERPKTMEALKSDRVTQLQNTQDTKVKTFN